MAEKKYIDLDGLGAFRTTLQKKLTGLADPAKTNWVVAEAVKATNDGSGNAITTTYATKTELTNGLAAKVSGVQVNGDDLTMDDNKKVNVTIATGAALGQIKVNDKAVDVYGIKAAAGYEVATDYATATSGTHVLDAYVAKDIDDRIKNLEGRGRFLSGWNAGDHKPDTFPAANPYAYKSGDYYLVSAVPASGTKYKPAGAQLKWTGAEGSEVLDASCYAEETESIHVGDEYLYDGTKWTLVQSGKSVTWGSIGGTLSNQTDLQSALNAKVTANTSIEGATKCKITYDAKGLVTAGADLAATDIPDLDAAKITTGTFADARIASAATWNAKYDKPADGIPSTDMTSAVQASLGKADTALQKADIATGATNGTIKVKDGEVAVYGLGGAAYKAADYYVAAETGKRLMTDAEGTKLEGIEAGAEVNIIEGVQVNGDDLTPDGDRKVNVTIATGSANGTIAANGVDVSVKGLGSAAYTESTAYATAAQGTKADAAAPGGVSINGHALGTDASNAIVLNGAEIKLDGYGKASASQAIVAGDTVNGALGKLEYKIDLAVAGGITDSQLVMPTGEFLVDRTQTGSVVINTVTYVAQNKNKVFAGPSTGNDGVPTFRALVSDDIPELAQSKITNLETDLGNKVDKELNKSLVADSEITKLAGVSAGANKVEASTTNGNIKIDGTETTVYTHPTTTAVAAAFKKVGNDANGHVVLGDAITKSDITTLVGACTTTANDLGMFTAAEKTKLNGIAAGAQVNVIETVKLNGTALSVENKTVDVVLPSATKGQEASVNGLTLEVVQTSGAIASVSGAISTATTSEIDALFA